MTTDDQRFAPPQAHVDDVATGEVELAGRGTRLVAAIIDGLIIICGLWILAGVLGRDKIFGADAVLQGQLAGAVLFLAIQGWSLVTRGQTLGKMIFGLRIVRTDGSPVSAGRMALRYGVGMLANIHPVVGGIYSLIDCLLIFRESRQCLHDTIADTKVIKL